MNENIAAGEAPPARSRGRTSAGTPSVAFLFPGLGGEIFDRFAEMARSSEAFADILARADTLVSRRLGKSISELVQLNSIANQERQRRLFRAPVSKAALSTEVAHCLLFTFECALAHSWMEWGLRPQYVMGYSLGEYSAACVAGLFGFEAGLSLVIERAALLMRLPAGAMICVSCASTDLPPELDPDVHVVAENSRTQTILGAEERVLERAARRLRDSGYAVQELPVELAFHTPLMEPAATGMARLFRAAELATPSVPLVSTLTGELVGAGQVTTAAHWVRHLCEPVQLRPALRSLLRLGVEVFLEVGPGQALGSIVATELCDSPELTIATSMPSDYDARPAALHLQRTARRLCGVGVPVRDTATIGLHLAPVAPTRAPALGELEAAVLDKIREIWASALQAASVRPDDNLFDLGGNSLRTAHMAMQIKSHFGIELSLRDIYTSPTPRQLANLVAEGKRSVADGAQLLTTLPNGLNIKCPSHAAAVHRYRAIFDERAYLRHGLHIGCEAVVVDVGADVGLFSMFAALEAQDIKLFSLETDPQLFEMLRFNLADVCESAVILNAGPPGLWETLQKQALERIDFLRMDLRGHDADILDSIATGCWRLVRQAVIEIGARRDVDTVRSLLISKEFNVTIEPYHSDENGAGCRFFAVR
jgi:phthiocerol/phenolphthiocerol synthesis type-I polyketide synthase E